MIEINGVKDIKKLCRQKGYDAWCDSHDQFKEQITLPEDVREDMKKWIDALESGEYDQAQEQLFDSNAGYCCLGVACKVAGVDSPDMEDCGTPSELSVGYDKRSTFLDTIIRMDEEWYTGYMENELTHFNDTVGLDFEEIAAILRWKYNIPHE